MSLRRKGQGRVGFVNFINTAGLYVPWREFPPLEGWDMREGAPTELNRELAQGEIDVGLVSSFAYGERADEYRLLPDLCISATGPVGSVFLFSTCPPEGLEGKPVYLTTQSATSVNLLLIILEDFYGVKPVYQRGDLDAFTSAPESCKGYLAIGDEALRLGMTPPAAFRLDLAEIWLERTRLPFVFAVWAVRRECWEENAGGIRALHRRLMACYEVGKAELERISAQVAPRIPISTEACLHYLRRGIELDFTARKAEGLLHFFERLHRRGRLPKIEALDLLPLQSQA